MIAAGERSGYTNGMTDRPTPQRSTLRWNHRTRRLEGTILGAPAEKHRAYQGELATGEVVTVQWDGTADALGDPYLYLAFTAKRVSGDPRAWRWFCLLSEVEAVTA